MLEFFIRIVLSFFCFIILLNMKLIFLLTGTL